MARAEPERLNRTNNRRTRDAHDAGEGMSCGVPGGRGEGKVMKPSVKGKRHLVSSHVKPLRLMPDASSAWSALLLCFCASWAGLA